MTIPTIKIDRESLSKEEINICDYLKNLINDEIQVWNSGCT